MFNTTINNTESKVVAMTQVVEKTITPDKVTEMYDKVREEVEGAIIKSIIVDSNVLNGVAMAVHEKYDTMRTIIHTRFILNGKEYVDKTYEKDISIVSIDRLFESLKLHYQKVVANNILIDIAPTAVRILK